MRITVFSMLICILCSGAALLGILGTVYCKKRSYVYANDFLIGIFFIAVRCLIPFSFFYTLNIYSYTILSFEHGTEGLYWGKPEILVFVWRLCLWIWIGGAVIKAFYVVYQQRRWEALLSRLPNSKHMPVLRKILAEKNCLKSVRLIEFPGNVIPCVVGLRKPKIVIPGNLSEKDLYYILLHELEHYQSGDLYFIALSQLLCVIYWWNPLVYLLRNLLKRMIEFRVDSTVAEHLSEEQKLDYSQSIINVLKQKLSEKNGKSNTALELRFCNTGLGLKKRFENIFYGEKRRSNYAALVIAMVLFFMSTWVVIEPSFSAQEMEQKYLTIFQESSCISEFGNYRLYVGKSHWFTLIRKEFAEEWPGGEKCEDE